MLKVPQLHRDVQEVENELRIARNRLQRYQSLGEELLASEARRVVEGHENLIARITSRIQTLTQ
jgi:hypothetical protein